MVVSLRSTLQQPVMSWALQSSETRFIIRHQTVRLKDCIEQLSKNVSGELVQNLTILIMQGIGSHDILVGTIPNADTVVMA